MKIIVALCLCLGGAALVGCGDDDDSGTNDAGVTEDSGSLTDGGSDSGSLPENQISGIIRNLLELPQSDANVCLLDDDEVCDVTGEDGIATLPGAPGEDPAVRITGDSLFTTIAFVTVDGTRGSFVGAGIQPGIITAVLNSIDDKDPPTADPAMGHLVVRAVAASGKTDLSGFTFALEKGAVDRVYYFGDVAASDLVDPELEESAMSGYGVMINIEPGEHTFTYAHDELGCTVEAWEGTEADTYRIPIEANTVTYLRLTGCAP